MSIVKIHLQRDPESNSQQKYLLTFIPELHYTVKSFLEFAKETLQIDSPIENMVLIEEEGYMLPHSIDAMLLKKGGYFKIKVTERRNFADLGQLWTAQKIPYQNQIDVEESESSSSQSTPKFSQKKLLGSKEKARAKNKVSSLSKTVGRKPINGDGVGNSRSGSFKKRRISSSKSSESYSSQESESSEQFPTVTTKKEKKKSKIADKSSAQLKKPRKEVQIVSRSSSSSEQSSEVQKKKVSKKIIYQSKPEAQALQSKSKSLDSRKVKKRIIEADSESSEESSERQSKRMKTMKIQAVSQKELSIGQQKSAGDKLEKVPPALRHRLEGSFQQHREQQWQDLTQEVLKKADAPLKTFLKDGNSIRFKEVELDEVKFVPKQSEWIEGTVSGIKDGTFLLEKVNQTGKPYRQKYEVKDINMIKPQVRSASLDQNQLKVFELRGDSQAAKTSNILAPEQIGAECKEGQGEDNSPRDSLEKFICGQVQYYFSDKNYPTDLFMHMHENKHPQKYISLKFFLNCPKIKKVLKSEDKLLQYLLEDEKRSERSFEIDEQKRMLRRKRQVEDSIEPVKLVANMEMREQTDKSGQALNSKPTPQSIG